MKQPFLQCLEQDLGRGLIKSILLAQLNPDDMSSCEKAEIIEELAGYLLASRATKTSDRFTICCLESLSNFGSDAKLAIPIIRGLAWLDDRRARMNCQPEKSAKQARFEESARLALDRIEQP